MACKKDKYASDVIETVQNASILMNDGTHLPIPINEDAIVGEICSNSEVIQDLRDCLSIDMESPKGTITIEKVENRLFKVDIDPVRTSEELLGNSTSLQNLIDAIDTYGQLADNADGTYTWTYTDHSGATTQVVIDTNVDVCSLAGERDPDSPTQMSLFCDKDGLGKYVVPEGIVEIDVCPEDGMERPPNLPKTEKFFWASGGREPVMMVQRVDDTFDPVGDFTEKYALALNGSILNGLGVLPCNINFQNHGFTVDSEIKIGGAQYGWTKNSTAGENVNIAVGDDPIPYNAAIAQAISFSSNMKN